MCQRNVLLSRGTRPGWTAQQGGAQSPVPGIRVRGGTSPGHSGGHPVGSQERLWGTW